MHLHPGIARLSCSDCQKHVYEIPSGKPQTYNDGTKEVPIDRPGDPPCDRCPRGGPENEWLDQMSWANVRMMQIYRQVKSGVTRLPAHLENCPLLADNIFLIDETLEELRQQRLADGVAATLAQFMTRS